MTAQPLYDLAPTVRMLIMAVLLASGPLLMVYLRHRRTMPLGRVHALTVVTLFLTFDLVLFGAFTRLTDSGLGCPDWPGCYGNASPVGAVEEISAAQRAMPTGPVTHSKAWIEMVHRYLAMAVGVLITALTAVAWVARRTRGALGNERAFWASLTLIWVCIQGLFGALTVTMKLFPLIVTLHLLGGYLLMVLLAIQVAQHRQDPTASVVKVGPNVRWWMMGSAALVMLQAAGGAWVSSNYAVLACSEFPTCQGSWWPLMDFSSGFELWRPLGMTSAGSPVSFQALTAIHMVHRLLALGVVVVLGCLAFHLHKCPLLRSLARFMAGLLLLQVLTGISNVVLGWPLLAAVLHTGGAGALLVVLSAALVRTQAVTARERDAAPGQRVLA